MSRRQERIADGSGQPTADSGPAPAGRASSPARPGASRSGVLGVLLAPVRFVGSLWRRFTAPDGPVEQDRPTLSYYTLLVATLFLLTFGLIMVFSARSVIIAEAGKSAFTTFLRYPIIAVVGLLAMVGVSRLSVSWLKRAAIPALVASCAMQTIIFLVPSVRSCAGGNCNWLVLPVVGQAQPAEFMKLGIALYLGWALATHPEWLGSMKKVLLWLMGPSVLAIGLVFYGGDLGTIVVMAILIGGGLWVAGLGRTWFAVLGVAGLVGFAGASMLSANRRARIVAWLYPEAADPLDVAYQPRHARYALGTGGWFGVGPGSSRQKWGYLTQAESDYIFAVLGEEFGIIGALIVIVLFMVVGWCCLRIIRRSQDMFTSVVVSSIMCWIVGQALVNMAVVVGLLPVLGVPLPFISAGGSSLIFVLAAVGVLLCLARHEPGAEEAFRAKSSSLRQNLAVIAPRRRKRD